MSNRHHVARWIKLAPYANEVVNQGKRYRYNYVAYRSDVVCNLTRHEVEQAQGCSRLCNIATVAMIVLYGWLWYSLEWTNAAFSMIITGALGIPLIVNLTFHIFGYRWVAHHKLILMKIAIGVQIVITTVLVFLLFYFALFGELIAVRIDSF